MKANELRIGNWFKTFEIDKNHGEEYFQVETLTTNNEGSLGVGFRNESCWSIIELIEPIPLTEEWLIKFGFEKSIDGFEMSKDITIRNNNGWVKEMVFFQIDDGLCGVSLRDIYDSGEKETYVIEIDIEYVHQLQNLYFALTNIELTIKE
jgi:hypothetical protein